MFRPLNLIAILSFLTNNAWAELTIVSAEFRVANSFKRISEYLTGKPSDGRYAAFRSNPDRRDGFYISLIASDRSELSKVSTVQIQFVPPGTQEISVLNIPADDIRKKRLLVGLTGPFWSDGDTVPLAWKVNLLDANETVIDSAQSFLWADPLP